MSWLYLATALLMSASAGALVRPTSHADCADMTTWDYVMGMCMPRAMGMPMRMVMLNGNGFAAHVETAGHRGQSAPAAPNMLMLDLGQTAGARSYFNLDVMTTVEKWTFPKDGYPELAQIGEHNAHGVPFVDAQHPHSSPLMGLTLSDTISFGTNEDHARVFFAPRGQSTDGPIAFMHRPTGMMMPDAPLGHHVGQDVGHVTSTVAGAGVRRGANTIQASGFHGGEPEPTAVDLPLGPVDSFAARVIREFGARDYASLSFAHVHAPEAHDGDHGDVRRYSASIYAEHPLGTAWTLRLHGVYGRTEGYDHAAVLNSFGHEFWLTHDRDHFWGRSEAVERSPKELAIGGLATPNRGRYVFALTLGLTHDVWRIEGLTCALGFGLTETFLPRAYQDAYGMTVPWSARAFLQLSGMKMWHF